jgi:hypothetical protein
MPCFWFSTGTSFALAGARARLSRSAVEPATNAMLEPPKSSITLSSPALDFAIRI